MKAELFVSLRIWVPHSVRSDTDTVPVVYKCNTLWDAKRQKPPALAT